MDTYIIERRGGFAGLTASATVAAADMDADDRESLDRMLDGHARLMPDPGADRFTYVVTRRAESGRTTQAVIPESMMPPSVARAVRDSV